MIKSSRYLFPQLLRGGSDEMLKSFNLQNDPVVYVYTKEGAATAVSLSFVHL